MSIIHDILIPLDGSQTAARGLDCAAWLARRLDAGLHVLNISPETLDEATAAERLCIPERHRGRVIVHHAHGHPREAILEVTARLGVNVIVMSARGEDSESARADDGFVDIKLVGHVTRHVIEQSPVPVLLVPPAYVDTLPWDRILVPVSGEARTDEALTHALRLAPPLGVEVTVAHVTGYADTGAELQQLSRYGDAPHHEYPALIDELIMRACPLSSLEERRRITDLCLCRGDVAEEFLKLIEEQGIDLLVVGWHGWFMEGHAQVLKHLIERMTCAVLLVKPQAPQPFRLKVGEDLE